MLLLGCLSERCPAAAARVLFGGMLRGDGWYAARRWVDFYLALRQSAAVCVGKC